MKHIKKIGFIALFLTIALAISACSSSEKEEESSEAALFDDSSCWTIRIDDVDYTFPMKYDEFASRGWEVYNLSTKDTLNPKQTNSTFEAKYSKTKTKFDLVFGNFGTTELDYTEGYIVGIGLNFGASEKANNAFPEIVLPKGIVFNERPSIEDIEAAYGAANDNPSDKLKYWYESNVLLQEWDPYFGAEGLNGFDLVNYANPEESN